MLAPFLLQRRLDLLAQTCETIRREFSFARREELPLFESDVTLQQCATFSKALRKISLHQRPESLDEGMELAVLGNQAADFGRHAGEGACDHREECGLLSGEVARKLFASEPLQAPALFAEVVRPTVAEEGSAALLKAKGQREAVVMLTRERLQRSVSFCHSDGSSYIRSNGVRVLTMAKLDLLLLVVFGVCAVVGLAVAFYCFRRSLKVASDRDGDIKMFFWAVGGLLGLIIAGMSSAYILLPILLH